MTDHTIAELQSIRTVLGLAFTDDPLMRWIFPDDRHRADLTATWLGLFAEGYASGGRVDTVADDDGSVIGVALWKIPSDVEVGMPELPGPLAFLGAVLDDSRAAEVIRSFASFVENWPTEPHAYLALLAVHPEHQGRGLGRLVVSHGIKAAESMGLDVALETNKSGNVGFYRSLGFDVTSEYRMEPDGPPGWSLRLRSDK